jgi:hypothetical protein
MIKDEPDPTATIDTIIQSQIYKEAQAPSVSIQLYTI